MEADSSPKIIRLSGKVPITVDPISTDPEKEMRAENGLQPPTFPIPNLHCAPEPYDTNEKKETACRYSSRAKLHRRKAQIKTEKREFYSDVRNQFNMKIAKLLYAQVEGRKEQKETSQKSEGRMSMQDSGGFHGFSRVQGHDGQQAARLALIFGTLAGLRRREAQSTCR